MKKTIFEYKTYKQYLSELIDSQPKKGRGFRTELAHAAHCQIAYVSQVLGGDRHFTFEQAEGINVYLEHSEDEARFFLLLLSHERAGTGKLRARYEKEIQRETEKHLTLKDRFKAKEVLSRETQMTYFSNWYFAAITMALTIAELRTKEALVRALGLKPSIVAKTLEFLVEAGLAEHRGTEYYPGVSNIYLGNDTPLIVQHHTNWRMRAIASLDAHNKDDLHYSAVVSIPSQEFAKIRETLTKAIEEARKHWVEATNEEQLCAVSMDWYKI